MTRRGACGLSVAWIFAVPQCVLSATCMDACVPAWATCSNFTDAVCPYGVHLLFDVTFSNDVHRSSPIGHVVLIFMSYVPVMIIVLAVVELVVTRGARQLNFCLFYGYVVGLNELLWKRMVRQPRPVGSCNFTCGMPSSHGAVSLGTFTFLFLDLAFRVDPLSPAVLTAIPESPRCISSYMADVFSLVPLSNARSISNWQFIRMVGFWGDLLLLVPVSRVLLQDHSVSQVSIGCAIGVLEAVIWFFMSQHLAWRYRGDIGRRWPSRWSKHLLLHNLSVPRHWELAELIRGDLRKARAIILKEIDASQSLTPFTREKDQLELADMDALDAMVSPRRVSAVEKGFGDTTNYHSPRKITGVITGGLRDPSSFASCRSSIATD